MDIKKMKIFCKVAEKLNMSKVARNMFITQSAVSQCIMDIEKELGKKLFDRFNNKLFLLKEGEIFYEYSKRIINLFYESIDAVGKKEELKLGASTTIGIYVLPYYIKGFSKDNKDCDVLLKIGNTEEILKLLLTNEIDIAFVEGIVNNESIVSEKIWEDNLVFICSNDNVFADKLILPKELINQKFILRETGSGTRQIIENAFYNSGISCNLVLEFGNTEAIKKAVEAGMGISCISEKAVLRELEYGHLKTFKVKNLNIPRYFYILRHKDKMLKRSAEVFVGFCESCHK
jgi:DNA-binding transcriptional LysR family regulator